MSDLKIWMDMLLAAFGDHRTIRIGAKTLKTEENTDHG